MRIRTLTLALGGIMVIAAALSGWEARKVRPTVTAGPVGTFVRAPYVTVSNAGEHEVEVWLLASDGSFRRRLGAVRALATESFALERHDRGVRVAVEERTADGGVLLTPAFSIGPRTLVRMTVTRPLAASRVVVSQLEALGCCGDAEPVRERLRAQDGS